jgi:hypothetical protein
MNLRVARHTHDLDKIKTFYTTVLGFEVLGSFENHDSYDGLFLGKPNLDWHLEFTKSDKTIGFNYNENDILVFYPNTIIDYNNLIYNILNNFIELITSSNPYWNLNGKMFLDPDGYCIVISKLRAE